MGLLGEFLRGRGSGGGCHKWEVYSCHQHAALSEAAFKLCRELTRKAPATKAAFKAEQEVFRLRCELQRLTLEDPEPAERRGPMPEVRQGGKAIDIERRRRGKLTDDTP